MRAVSTPGGGGGQRLGDRIEGGAGLRPPS